MGTTGTRIRMVLRSRVKRISCSWMYFERLIVFVATCQLMKSSHVPSAVVAFQLVAVDYTSFRNEHIAVGFTDARCTASLVCKNMMIMDRSQQYLLWRNG